MGIWPGCQSCGLKSGRGDAYSSDASLGGDLSCSINVDLVKVDGRVLRGKFFEDGTDHFARTTPGCPKVEDSDLVTGNLITNEPSQWRLKVNSLGIQGVDDEVDPRFP